LLCISQTVLAGILYGQAQSAPAAAPADETQTPEPAKSASVSGIIVDKDGAVIANAKITLTQNGSVTPREAISGGDGSFIFADVAPGSYQLSCTAAGFAPQQRSGVLHAGEAIALPQIELEVGLATVDVEVTLKQEVEIAEQQIHVEEKQRLFGAIPNFYVSYVPNAVPLTTRQKYELAWKSSIDPVSFGLAAISAGFEQANNSFSGYGQGAQGYGKRFGAS
jgi:hypothetical protein